MRVRATKAGYYGKKLRKVGEEFEIRDKSALGSWMVSLEKERPAAKTASDPKGDSKSDGTSGGSGGDAGGDSKDKSPEPKTNAKS